MIFFFCYSVNSVKGLILFVCGDGLTLTLSPEKLQEFKPCVELKLDPNFTIYEGQLSEQINLRLYRGKAPLARPSIATLRVLILRVSIPELTRKKNIDTSKCLCTVKRREDEEMLLKRQK